MSQYIKEKRHLVFLLLFYPLLLPFDDSLFPFVFSRFKSLMSLWIKKKKNSKASPGAIFLFSVHLLHAFLLVIFMISFWQDKSPTNTHRPLSSWSHGEANISHVSSGILSFLHAIWHRLHFMSFGCGGKNEISWLSSCDLHCHSHVTYSCSLERFLQLLLG